jgi:hypothetical protein
MAGLWPGPAPEQEVHHRGILGADDRVEELAHMASSAASLEILTARSAS